MCNTWKHKTSRKSTGSVYYLILMLVILFFVYVSGKKNKCKNKQMLLHQTKKTFAEWRKLSIKLKGYLLKKKKRLPTEWEKIFANDMTNKWLICKMYKESIQFNIKKQTNLIWKWEENLNTIFSKKTYRWSTGTQEDLQ